MIDFKPAVVIASTMMNHIIIIIYNNLKFIII